MTPFDLLKLSAASWYLAYIVTSSAGPFDVFVWVREHLPLGGLTSCIICLMVWCAVFLYIFTILQITPVVDVLAIAGLALWAHSWTNWRMKL